MAESKKRIRRSRPKDQPVADAEAKPEVVAETPVIEKKLFKLMAVKADVVNPLTMVRYYVNRPTIVDPSVQEQGNWEKAQLEAGLLRVL